MDIYDIIRSYINYIPMGERTKMFEQFPLDFEGQIKFILDVSERYVDFDFADSSSAFRNAVEELKLALEYGDDQSIILAKARQLIELYPDSNNELCKIMTEHLRTAEMLAV
jgi:hypothetical protein